MIRIPSGLAARIRQLAEEACPEECCGLLVGRPDEGGSVQVTRLVPSPNILNERATDRFEVDPQIRFDLMRQIRGTDESLIGHYHSHPNHPAQPSDYDLERAMEPDLIWLIVSLTDGKADDIKAHRLEGDGFMEEALEITQTD
ncbi:MAG: M67 family metallopeptidase [Rhodospirillales bacterium]|nr:M67 family metallopeptidase [Rhodospirillales bacterium]